MNPAKRNVWLPLTRLTAFFVAVVVTGNLLFRAVHALSRNTPAPPSDIESYEQRKRKALKKLTVASGLLETGLPRMAPVEEPRAEESRKKEEKPASPERPVLIMDPVLAEWNENESESLGYLKTTVLTPGSVGMPWTPPEKPLFDMSCPVCGRVVGISEFHHLDFYGTLADQWERSHRYDSVELDANRLFSLPERIMDNAAIGVSSLFGQEHEGTWRANGDEHLGVTERFMRDFVWRPTDGLAFNRFLQRALREERGVIMGYVIRDQEQMPFDPDPMNIDAHDFMALQQRVLASALRDTYLSRFSELGRAARGRAQQVREWRGIDLVIAPMVIAGGLYFAGLRKEISIDGTELRMEIDPFRRLRRAWLGEADLMAAVRVEWGIKRFPIKLIAASGLEGGRPVIEFVGIGTSVSLVKGMLEWAQAQGLDQ